MATATLIPVSEYLNTTYRPDCDYIDGELKERNVGERPHGTLQLILGAIFRANKKAWDIVAMGDQRVQVSPTRYRIPDVCVVRRSDPNENVVRSAPLLCVEILSRKDTLAELQERVDDYLAMGVENIWVLDPWKKRALTATARGYEHAEDGFLRIADSPIELNTPELFAELESD